MINRLRRSFFSLLVFVGLAEEPEQKSQKLALEWREGLTSRRRQVIHAYLQSEHIGRIVNKGGDCIAYDANGTELNRIPEHEYHAKMRLENLAKRAIDQRSDTEKKIMGRTRGFKEWLDRALINLGLKRFRWVRSRTIGNRRIFELYEGTDYCGHIEQVLVGQPRESHWNIYDASGRRLNDEGPLRVYAQGAKKKLKKVFARRGCDLKLGERRRGNG